MALLCAARVLAAPTGLTTIPTVDVAPMRQLTFQFQNANTNLSDAPTLWHEPQMALQFQTGVRAARIEAGADLVVTDPPEGYAPIFNAKAVLLAEGEHWPAVAAGVAQVGSGVESYAYAVVTRTLDYHALQYQRFRAHHRNVKLRGRRAHAGLLRTPERVLALAGSDLELSDHFLLVADWIAGDDHAASLGLTWVVDPLTTLQMALLRGNGSGRVDGLQAGITRQFGF